MKNFSAFRIVNLILLLDTGRVETNAPIKNSDWLKTPYANLVRYKRSGKYFARLRVRGKLIRRSLKRTRISVAKLRFADLEKDERQKAEHHNTVTEGEMTFADALAVYRQRLVTDNSLKPRSKIYREERIAALLKSWPSGPAQKRDGFSFNYLATLDPERAIDRFQKRMEMFDRVTGIYAEFA